jgi:hypothetical protein
VTQCAAVTIIVGAISEPLQNCCAPASSKV